MPGQDLRVRRERPVSERPSAAGYRSAAGHGSAAGHRAAASTRSAVGRRSAAGRRPAPDVLVRLVSRLLVAQSGATAAIGISFSKRTMPWLLVTILVAVAVCGLACLVRSGTHGIWLLAISVESGLVAVGLFTFAYAGYVGGTLLSIVTLGTLLHPAVAGAFAASPRWLRSGQEPAGLPDSAAEALQDPAVS